MMKKKILPIMLITLSVLFVLSVFSITFTIFAVELIGSKINPSIVRFEKDGYFDSWESEVDERYMVVDDYGGLPELGARIGLENYNVVDIYAMTDDRVYFMCTEVSDDDGRYSNGDYPYWVVYSIDLKTGGDIRKHYELLSACDYYEPLSLYSNPAGKRGGYFSNGYIYLKPSVFTYRASLDGSWDLLHGNIPEKEYAFLMTERKDEVMLIDRESGEQKVLTLDKMAQMNEYAARLQSLSGTKSVGGNDFNGGFFDSIEIIDGEIFIGCRVLDFWAKPALVYFKYDFDTDELRYVHSYASNDAYTSYGLSLVRIYDFEPINFGN